MNDNDVLSEIKVSTPCPMGWNQMSGDDCKRYCTVCGKHVHDFAKLTSAEAAALFHDANGDLCGRLSRRADGTIVTGDRAVAVEPLPTPWQFNIRSLMGVVAGFAAMLGIARLFAGDAPKSPSLLTPKVPLMTPVLGKVAYRPLITSPAPSSGQSSQSQAGCPDGR
jgi:hypothetical protein